jgi:hypothetical protein
MWDKPLGRLWLLMLSPTRVFHWFRGFKAESMIIESDILFRFGIERNDSFNSLMTAGFKVEFSIILQYLHQEV